MEENVPKNMKKKSHSVLIMDDNIQTLFTTNMELKTCMFLDVASTGQIATLKALVNSEGSIDCCDITGKSALWLAIERENDVAVETLLKAGADVNKTYKSRQTPLMFAVDKGRIKYIQFMLEAGAEVDSVDSFGMSALMIACQRRNVEILQILIAAGASLRVRDIRGKTGLMIAIENNGCECLKYLIEAGAEIQIKDFQGNSPLVTAVFQNCETCVQTLAHAGASLNEAHRSGKTVLMIAVERESNVLQVLIQNRANLDETDNRLKTATMYAARFGRVSSLAQLVQASADLNLKDDLEQTALMMAAEEGHVACIECLIKGGARQDFQDCKGKTALMLAALGRHPECLQVLSCLNNCKDTQCRDGKTALIYALESISNCITNCLSDLLKTSNTQQPLDAVGRRDFIEFDLATRFRCVQILLNASASPIICDRRGMSPLMYAARVDVFARCFQYLVDAGADVNSTDRSGLTALGHAATCENMEFIKKLIEAGAPVNTSTHTGETPLLILAKNPGSANACASIACLLDYNADVNVQDPGGMTPLMWAAKSTAGTKVMSLLVSHGAAINMTDKSGFSALYHTIHESDELLGNARYLLDSGANPNLRTSLGKSAVSVTVRVRNRALLELLLKHNAEPCVDLEDLCYLVQRDDRRMLQYVVLHGLFPSSTVSCQDTIMTVWNQRCLAMAKYLLAIGYLNISDIMYRFQPREFSRTFYSHRIAQSNASVVTFLGHPMAQSNASALTVLNSVYSQPWPLVKLCFMAVSNYLGSSDREGRVRRSGLPDRLQRMLLFQEPISKLCVNHWDSIPLCFDPDDYEKLPKPRPLLFYWPFGRDLTPCGCDECCQAGFRFL